MALTDVKDGSKGFVKRVASSFSMRNKKNPTSPPNLLPRSKSTGSSTNYESMKLIPSKKLVSDVTGIKSLACVTPLPRREKIDDRGGNKTNKKFANWRSFDDSTSIWPSLDCASPTSLLEEHRLSVSFRFSVDDSVVSWLSKLASFSLSLNHQETSSNKDRFKIPRNYKTNAAENIHKKALKEDFSAQSSLEKRVSFSQSSDTKLDTNKSFLVHEKNMDEKSAEIVDSKNITKVDEPLFWPYEERFDWTPEDILKHFSMSPRRKKLSNAKISASTSPRSMRAQLLQTRKVELKDGCKRKLIFNGPITNTSKTTELKRTISNNKNEPIKNCVKRNKSLPSRLRKSSKTCSKVVPIIEAVEEVNVAEMRAQVEITARKLINRRSKTMLEDDLALLDNDFSIENAVGLGEFNGREGIDSEFNSETFLFDDSL